MQSKSKRTTPAEREHIRRVRELPCSLCDAPGPSEAHHLRQDIGYSCAALCIACHRGPLGWHGTKALWRIRKMDEHDALYKTVERLCA